MKTNKSLIFFFFLIGLKFASSANAQFTQEGNNKDNWQGAWNISTQPIGKQNNGGYAWTCMYRSDDNPSYTFSIVHVRNDDKVWGACPNKIWFELVKQKWKIREE
jgi:hypothetical protein